MRERLVGLSGSDSFLMEASGLVHTRMRLHVILGQELLLRYKTLRLFATPFCCALLLFLKPIALGAKVPSWPTLAD